MQLDDTLEGYWLSKRRNMSPHTIQDYTIAFRRLTDFLGDVEFEKISANDINQFLERLVSEGQPELLGHPGLLAFTTLARQTYLAVACTDRYRGNPTRSAGLPDRYAGLRYLIRPAMDKVKLRTWLK